MSLSSPPDKRRRRTREQIETLQAQIFNVLKDGHPQSVRHVFYRMTDPNLTEPVAKESEQQSLLELARSVDGTAP